MFNDSDLPHHVALAERWPRFRGWMIAMAWIEGDNFTRRSIDEYLTSQEQYWSRRSGDPSFDEACRAGFRKEPQWGWPENDALPDLDEDEDCPAAE